MSSQEAMWLYVVVLLYRVSFIFIRNTNHNKTKHMVTVLGKALICLYSYLTKHDYMLDLVQTLKTCCFSFVFFS